MGKCVLCGRKTGMFAKRTYEGCICKECLSYIPRSVRLSSADTDYLRNVHDKNLKKMERFSSTASYGALFMDSVHNMFCVSRKRWGDEPTEFGDIYCVTELREIGLYCTDVRNIGTNSNRIVCNVKIRIKTDEVCRELLVASNERCTFHYVGNSQIEWSEPSKLSVFRSMFNQMIDNEVFGLLKKLEAVQEMKAAISEAERNEQWAKGVFFFRESEDVLQDALKKRRNALVKIFHPDLGQEFADNEITAQINEAYKMLMK